jgi:hypothetical protein
MASMSCLIQNTISGAYGGGAYGGGVGGGYARDVDY